MKSLKIIQILAKIAWIICKIVFIACIVGASCCLLGLILIPIFKDVVVYEGKSVEVLIAEKGHPLYESILACAVGFASCGTGIFLGKYNELFFKEELDVGTPFKHEIVKKMRKVAIVDIAVSFALGLVCAIAVAIVEHVNHTTVDFKYELMSFVGFGISLLIISLFCEYGADVSEPKSEESNLPEEK